MTGTIAITDHGWYEFLLTQPDIDEVNFWTPSSHFSFKGQLGSPFFFKLKAEYHHAICGFAFFARYAALPDWLAWESFEIKNGVPNLEALQERVGGLRKSIQYRSAAPSNQIGCILLSQPVFFPRDAWVEGPRDWSRHNLRYKYYEIGAGEGLRIWEECKLRVRSQPIEPILDPTTAVHEAIERYGPAVLVQPRLGQGTFRVAVLDAYSRACAITLEHSLPALEASHIKPYGQDGPHSVSNGVLLRSDLHRLFDKGYLTITPDYRVEVSARLKVDFHNGKTYYPLHGQKILVPENQHERPAQDLLRWHNEKIYKTA